MSSHHPYISAKRNGKGVREREQGKEGDSTSNC